MKTSRQLVLGLTLLASLIPACAEDLESGSADAFPEKEDTGAVAEQALGGDLVTTAAHDQIKLVRAFTGYGQNDVDCPGGMVALGGGARCSDGELDTTTPKMGYVDGEYLPTGWSEWHRGASSNDCWVYAVCAPATWFGQNELKVVQRDTYYGQGTVNCPTNWKATGGGSRCTNGDLDMAYPNASLSGYNEWHRGASSNDCKVSAVCVSNANWVAQSVYLTIAFTGYGNGRTSCGGNDIALGGGSKCTDGDSGDYDYPSSDLRGWEEWHRGRSSNDCSVYGVCLRASAIDRVTPGVYCAQGSVYDCSGKCMPSAVGSAWKVDSYCDNGQYGYNLVCKEFDFDGNACNR